MGRVLGLDIGGASLKAAIVGAGARSIKFPLWQKPNELGDYLRALIDILCVDTNVRFDRVAVTMTGELCDAFETRAVGVDHIVTQVAQVFREQSVHYFQTDGTFVDAATARGRVWKTAASNWLAQALWVHATLAERMNVDAVLESDRSDAATEPAGVGRPLVGSPYTAGGAAEVSDRSDPATHHPSAAWAALRLAHPTWGLLIDIGSTTTDIIPMGSDGVVECGTTDAERLRRGSLVYVGIERTPACALVDVLDVRGERTPVMNELFATTLDAALWNGLQPEDDTKTDTADGRPATKWFARGRLARLVGLDHTCFDDADALHVSEQIVAAMVTRIVAGVERIVGSAMRTNSMTSICAGDAAIETVGIGPHSEPYVITSGQGESLFARLADRHAPLQRAKRLSLTALHGPDISTAACAHAVAWLLEQDKRQEVRFDRVHCSASDEATRM